MPELPNLRVDGARLWDSLMEMAEIGGTPKGGCNRLTLTDLDREARALFARWTEVSASDPFHNPLLGRGTPSVVGLAWPPGDLSPRRSTIRQPRAVPPGW